MRRQAERARRRGLDWLGSALACLAALIVVHWGMPSGAPAGGPGVGADAPAAAAPPLAQRELGRAAGPETHRLKVPGDPVGGGAAMAAAVLLRLADAGAAAPASIVIAAARATPAASGFDARAPPRPA